MTRIRVTCRVLIGSAAVAVLGACTPAAPTPGVATPGVATPGVATTAVPATTAPPTDASTTAVPVGYYQCFNSFTNSGSGTGYGTATAGSFTLYADGTYKESLRGLTGHWSSASNSIAFVGGGFDDSVNGRHDYGTYVPGGATLPNNQINDGSVYTIVVQGSPGTSDTAPPATESEPFHGSYWYCKFRGSN